MWKWLSALVLLAGTGLCQDCSTQLSVGTQAWSSNNQTFNYYSLSLNSSVVAPPWQLQVFGEASLSPYTYNWNLSDGNVYGFDDTLLPDDPVHVGFVASGLHDGSPAHIAEVHAALQGCMLSTATASDMGSIESGLQPVSIVDTVLHGTDGQPLKLIGINWFGFETEGGSMVDGLWETSTSLSGDFYTVLYRMKLLGFNAIRLPFSFKNLYSQSQPTSFTTSCSTDNWQTVVQTTIDPDVGYTGPTPEPLLTSSPGICNSYLPNDNTLDRFLFVLRTMAQSSMYIIIDNHLNLDTTLTDNPTLWVQQWQQLAKSIAADPVINPWVLMDIANEPDSLNLRWEAANGLPSMTQYYLAAMDAIANVIPTQVFLIEGLGQVGSAICWGNGYITDQDVIRKTGISDPTPFFTQLLTKPYLTNVALAPHIYGPSISHNTEYSGQSLFSTLSMSMGYLNKQGFCADGHCQPFPIIIGETGSALTDMRDFDFYTSFIQYMNNDGPGNDGLHNDISSTVWWSWNANSGDTKGIVQDDWTTINWLKVQLLQHLQSLTPVYAPNPPEATSPLNTGNSATTESFTGTTIIPAPPVFDTALHGFVLPLTALQAQDTTAFGDFGTILQRMKALGFSAVQIPFKHEQVHLNHTCHLTSNESLLTLTNPPTLNISNITAVNRGALPVVQGAATAPQCNAFAAGLDWITQLMRLSRMVTANGMYVLLQDTDTELALLNPEQWLSDWARIAATMYGAGNHTLLSFVGYSSNQPEIAWHSAGQPGLGELVYTAMRVVHRILPNVLFAIEGVDGYDFDDASDFFRQAVGSGFVNNLIPYSSSGTVDADDAFTELSNKGVCLTDAACQLLPNIALLHDNITTANWFIHTPDETNITWDQINELQQVGLTPWFTNPTAYRLSSNRPTISPTATVESDSATCQCDVRLVAVSSKPPYTFGMHFSFNNLSPATILPPWQFSLTSANIQQVLSGLGFSNEQQSANSYNASATSPGSVLWPSGTSGTSVSKLLIVIADNVTTVGWRVEINGDPCDLLFLD